MTTAGVVTGLFPLPTVGALPAAITSGPDGALWFVEAFVGKIGRITTAGVITEFTIPTASSFAAITSGPDGALWFAENSGSKLGRITTAGMITELLPSRQTAIWLASQLDRTAPYGLPSSVPTRSGASESLVLAQGSRPTISTATV